MTFLADILTDLAVNVNNHFCLEVVCETVNRTHCENLIKLVLTMPNQAVVLYWWYVWTKPYY